MQDRKAKNICMVSFVFMEKFPMTLNYIVTIAQGQNLYLSVNDYRYDVNLFLKYPQALANLMLYAYSHYKRNMGLQFLSKIISFDKDMQIQVHLAYSLFRVPEVEVSTTKKRKVVAGLIDASGSMGSYWAAMAKFWNQSIAQSADFLITFSHIAKLEENPVLSEDLKKHGGGMTNIYAAFEKLEDRLMSVPEDASITIVFISDGQDTTNGEAKLREKMKGLKGGQGRDITMLCLGIQSGFPTKMSMDIRELYHTGDEKIPALYLIEYASEKAFFNKFESMANCFKVSNQVRCTHGQKDLKEYPWEKDGSALVKEGQWLMVHNTAEAVSLIYNETVEKTFPLMPVESLDLDDVVDCFRGWVQKVQLLSMDNAKMGETAKIAHETANIMRDYTTAYENYHKLYIFSERPLGLKESFKERASSLIVKNVGSRIKWFIDELRIIGKGLGIGQLNEYEAAKRIGIGTITGKYHQKALALKGITVKDFQLIKEQFTSTFEQVKLSAEASSQQVSIFTLQNQKEVFQQADFLEGLRLCKNQYDLVQSFPVVGYSLKVKRYDGSMINPWKVRVLQLAKTHNSIDSVYLANNSNKYELSVGEGKVEEINAVLPLFGEDDAEMSALFNTRLFKLAVSFMVVQNIDTYHQQAYLALLASTFVFLVREPPSEWRDNLVRKIHSSLKVTYWQNQDFREFLLSSLDNPHQLFTSKEKEDHTDVAKVMLLVYFIGREKLVPPAQLAHLIDLVMVHYVEKTYVENEFKLSRVANIEVRVDEEGLVKGKVESEGNEFNTVQNYEQLKKLVEDEVSKVVDTDKIDVSFDVKIFLHSDEERRVTYEHIRHFYQAAKRQKFEPDKFIFYFGHALKGKGAEVYRTPVSFDLHDVKREVFKQIDMKSLGPNQGKQIKQLKKLIQDRYVDQFQRTHFGIAPLSKARLLQICSERGINAKDLHWNETSGMINNACMSPRCKYFLQPMKQNQFSEHMKMWKKQKPTRFHFSVVVKLKQKKKPLQIFDELVSSGEVDLVRHKKTKEEVLEYINLIANSLLE